MSVRPLVLLMVLLAGIAVFATACDGEPEPVPQPQVTASETRLPNSAVLPQVAHDGVAPTATPTPPGTFTYTVVAGDTLYSIARRFGTTVAVLAELNHLADPTKISVGQVLRIPAGGTTPTPTPTTGPSGPSQLVTNGPRGTAKVALTFDMGGRVDPALDIVNYLIAHQVHATIFVTGAMVENQNTDAGRQVIALVQAHPELFDLGNHSYSHPDFTTLTATEMTAEIQDTEAAVATYISRSPRPYFRPPFGAYNSAVLSVLGSLGYSRTIMWDIDTIDWRPEEEGGPTASGITTKILNNVQGGSIILMHLGGYNTFESLPGTLQGLADRGLTPVKISEMID